MDSALTEATAVTPQRRDRGFTLVELLIVIVILGVLSTVAVFAVRGITNRGDAAACQSDYKTLETAVEAYIAQNTGATSVTEAQLVTAGLLRSESTKYNITALNDIDVATGSGCTYDPDGI